MLHPSHGPQPDFLPDCRLRLPHAALCAQPGGTFYGVDKLDGGKIVIFGGGIPLKSGNTIIGGLGISGGTGEEDHSLAEYGQSVLNEIL